MPIDLKPCESSQIESFGYDRASQTLAVKFRRGGLYHYADVPADVFDCLCACDSTGSFIHREIKGKFKFEKQEQAS